MIRNIIFDVGYVLIGYSWKEQFLRFGYSAEEVVRLAGAMFGEGVPDGSRPLWEKYDCGEVTDGEIRSGTVRLWNGFLTILRTGRSSSLIWRI